MLGDVRRRLRRSSEPAAPLPAVRVRGSPAAQGLPAARPDREAVAGPRRRRGHARRRGADDARSRSRQRRMPTATEADGTRARPAPAIVSVDFDVDRQACRHLADAQVNVELDTGDMILNLGPQHPATHGTLRLVVRLDGERVVSADPVIGYMHRGYEKLTEFRTYPQITTLINRIDWLSSFANEVPFMHARRAAHGHRGAAARAVHPDHPHRAVAHRDVRALPRRDGPAGRRAHARRSTASATASTCSTSSRPRPVVGSTPTSTASAGSRTTCRGAGSTSAATP